MAQQIQTTKDSVTSNNMIVQINVPTFASVSPLAAQPEVDYRSAIPTLKGSDDLTASYLNHVGQKVQHNGEINTIVLEVSKTDPKAILYYPNGLKAEPGSTIAFRLPYPRTIYQDAKYVTDISTTIARFENHLIEVKLLLGSRVLRGNIKAIVYRTLAMYVEIEMPVISSELRAIMRDYENATDNYSVNSDINRIQCTILTRPKISGFDGNQYERNGSYIKVITGADKLIAFNMDGKKPASEY